MGEHGGGGHGTNVEQNVNTTFRVTDKATTPLQKMLGTASRVNSTFNHLSHTLTDLVGLGGLVGGALTLKGAWEGATEYAKKVKDISELTGMAADKTDGMLNAMRSQGVELNDAERVIMILSKRGAAFQQQMAGAQANAGGMTRMMVKMGVDLRKGPEKALLQMSAAVKKGKIDAGQLMRTFGVPMTAVNDMMDFLGEGPEEIQRSIDKLKKSGQALNADNISAFSRMSKATRQIKMAWDRMALMFGRELFPVVADLMEQISKKMPGWIDKAKEFGKWLKLHLNDAIGLASKLGKILLANAILQKVTGKGIGDHGESMLGKVGRFVFKGPGSGPKAIGSALMKTDVKATSTVIAGSLKRGFAGLMSSPKALWGGLKAAPGAIKALPERAAMGLLRGIPGLLTGGGGMLGKLKGGMNMSTLLQPLVFFVTRGGPIIARLALLIGRFTLIGAVIGAIVMVVMKTYDMITKNTMGVRDMIVGFWTQVQARVAVIKDLLEPVLAWFRDDGPIGHFFITTIYESIKNAVLVADGLLHLLQTMILMFAKMKNNFWQVLKSPIDSFKAAWDEADKLTMAKAKQQAAARAKAEADEEKRQKAASKKPPGNIYDFRGSRFDVTQNFAEGFDPDRIAVAFSSDLAKLGDRKIQSGFTPLYSVR